MLCLQRFYQEIQKSCKQKGVFVALSPRRMTLGIEFGCPPLLYRHLPLSCMLSYVPVWRYASHATAGVSRTHTKAVTSLAALRYSLPGVPQLPDLALLALTKYYSTTDTTCQATPCHLLAVGGIKSLHSNHTVVSRLKACWCFFPHPSSGFRAAIRISQRVEL